MKPRFPVTDHCDGNRFFNPGGVQARSFSDLPKWWWERWRSSIKPWPKSAPATAVVRLPESVPPGKIAATFIDHATYLLQLAGCTVLTDPVFSNRAGPFGLFGPKRVRPPALRLNELPRVDVVLLSHNHYDHLDVSTLWWLSRHRQPLIAVPLGLKTWLESRSVSNVVELDWWQQQVIGAGIELTCTPAQHWSSRWPWDRCRTLWGGFMLNASGRTIYYSGDTGWGTHFAEIHARLGAPDLALLPIGAYEPRWFMQSVHMNPDEAVRAHLALGTKRSVAMHYGTFQLTDENIDAPLHDLATALQVYDLHPKVFVAPRFNLTTMADLD